MKDSESHLKRLTEHMGKRHDGIKENKEEFFGQIEKIQDNETESDSPKENKEKMCQEALEKFNFLLKKVRNCHLNLHFHSGCWLGPRKREKRGKSKR